MLVSVLLVHCGLATGITALEVMVSRSTGLASLFVKVRLPYFFNFTELDRCNSVGDLFENRGLKWKAVDNRENATITAGSNIAIGSLFSEKPTSHKFPHLKCFDIISSKSFLWPLRHSPVQTEGGLKLAPDNSNLFKRLKLGYPMLRRP